MSKYEFVPCLYNTTNLSFSMLYFLLYSICAVFNSFSVSLTCFCKSSYCDWTVSYSAWYSAILSCIFWISITLFDISPCTYCNCSFAFEICSWTCFFCSSRLIGFTVVFSVSLLIFCVLFPEVLLFWAMLFCWLLFCELLFCELLFCKLLFCELLFCAIDVALVTVISPYTFPKKQKRREKMIINISKFLVSIIFFTLSLYYLIIFNYYSSIVYPPGK